MKTTAVIAAVAAIVGMVYVSSWGRTPHSYQEVFGPALLWACGRGFEEPLTGQCAALDNFLHPDVHANHPPVVDRFDCADLPQDLETGPLIYFQKAHRYLLFAAAATWRLFGVAWSSLTPLYGLLFGISAITLYGLFRVGVGRLIAALCTLLLVVSPVQLNNLVRLRDYAKAPFVLGALLLMALLVSRPMSRRARVLLCAAGGLYLGLGLGFRMDVSAALPAFVFCILVFMPGAFRATWRERLWCVAALTACYAAVGAPMLLAEGGSSKYHYFFMGQAEIYDQRLGVGGAPYQLVHRYFDAESLALLQAHALNEYGTPRHYSFFTPEYDAIGRMVARRMLATFPADQITRAFAAVVRTIDELGSGPENAAPRETANTFVRRLYELHSGAMSLLLRYARYAVIASLLILAARSPRLGFAALFLLLYFAGYGAVQFASRHYFHMQFVSLWAVAFLVACVLRLLLRARDPAARAQRRLLLVDAAWIRSTLRNAAIFSACSLFLFFAPLHALRVYQSFQATHLLSLYETAPRTSLPWAQRAVEERVRMVPEQLFADANAPGRDFDFAVLVAEVDTTESDVPFMVLYDGHVPDTAISWGGTLPRNQAGSTHLYFPVFRAAWNDAGTEWTRFAALELHTADADKLLRLSRIDAPDRLPLLLTAVLPPDWRNRPLYQQFTR